MTAAANNFDRYHRQMLLPGIGEDGQQRLHHAHALVVGCGALGSVIIDCLARAGVGTLTIVDRDVLEITNLQRQVLYDEADVENAMPKAEAARLRVKEINQLVNIRAHVDDFNCSNAEIIARGADIILDGLDNFETRYLLNDLAVKRSVPYIYGGAVGTTGVSLTILPHPAQRADDEERKIEWTEDRSTPCLRCVFPEAPPPGTSPTCDTAGVLGPVVMQIASYQAAQAIKLLTNNLDALDRKLLSIDVWSNDVRQFDVSNARDHDKCPCCGQGNFEFLEGETGSAATSLCGRNAVQVTPAPGKNHTSQKLDLERIATQLAPHGSFTHNRFLLRGTFTSERDVDGKPIELTLFPNGRAIIKGTNEPDTARTIYAKYVGV